MLLLYCCNPACTTAAPPPAKPIVAANERNMHPKHKDMRDAEPPPVLSLLRWMMMLNSGQQAG
jgi:hypothetical protein